MSGKRAKFLRKSRATKEETRLFNEFPSNLKGLIKKESHESEKLVFPSVSDTIQVLTGLKEEELCQ